MIAAAPHLTFEDVWARVGAPAIEGALYTRQYETVTIYAWEDLAAGMRGWSWAIVHDGKVVDCGWGAGDSVHRDEDIERAIDKLQVRLAKRMIVALARRGAA